MKWITNCSKQTTRETISELTLGRYKGRKIVIGDPYPSQWLTVEDLKARQLVGLYDA